MADSKQQPDTSGTICYTTANSEEDLQGILALQKANLTSALSIEEVQTQGFVTVAHTYTQLKNLNDREKHIIAKENNMVVAYLLAMTSLSKSDIPILVPMFDEFDKIAYSGKKVASSDYIVVGQVCVDKKFRRQGIVDKCYNTYKEYYKTKYSFAITEIAAANTRSLNAHSRIGFEEIHRYIDPNGLEWIIVLWNWNL